MSGIVERLRTIPRSGLPIGHTWNACDDAADEIEKLREVLEHTVTLFEQILDAIDADPVETMIVLRKDGVELDRITASQCFNKARALLGEKE